MYLVYLDFLIILNLNHHYLCAMQVSQCWSRGVGVCQELQLGWVSGWKGEYFSPRCGMIPQLLLCLSRIFGLGV